MLETRRARVNLGNQSNPTTQLHYWTGGGLSESWKSVKPHDSTALLDRRGLEWILEISQTPRLNCTIGQEGAWVKLGNLRTRGHTWTVGQEGGRAKAGNKSVRLEDSTALLDRRRECWRSLGSRWNVLGYLSRSVGWKNALSLMDCLFLNISLGKGGHER